MNSESQLIELAVQGDHAAFTRLVELHQNRLYASMLQVTGSAEEAEDVVQEAFIRAFMKLDSFFGLFRKILPLLFASKMSASSGTSLCSIVKI